MGVNNKEGAMATGGREGMDRRSAIRLCGLMGLGVLLTGCGTSQTVRTGSGSGNSTQARCSVCGAPAVYYICPR